MSEQTNEGAVFRGQQQVADYLGRSLAYVSASLVGRGLLNPIEGTPGRQQQFRIADVKKADEIASAAATAARRRAAQRAREATAQRREASTLPSGVESRRQAADRKCVSDQTVKKWEQKGWLRRYEAAPDPLHGVLYLCDDVDAAAELAAHARAAAQARFEASRARGLENAQKARWPDSPGLSERAAGAHAGVGKTAVTNARRSGRLLPVSAAPFRYSPTGVDAAFTPLIERGYVTLASLADRIEGADDSTLARLHYVVKKLKIKPRLCRADDLRGIKQPQACIREERVAEVLKAEAAIRGESRVPQGPTTPSADGPTMPGVASLKLVSDLDIDEEHDKPVRQTFHDHATQEFRRSVWQTAHAPVFIIHASTDHDGVYEWMNDYHRRIIEALMAYTPAEDTPRKLGPTASELAQLLGGKLADKTGHLDRALRDLREHKIVGNEGSGPAATGYYLIASQVSPANN